MRGRVLEVSRGLSYGVDPSNSFIGGVFISAAAANTKGSWNELVASTSAPIRWLDVTISWFSENTCLNAAFDIGVGPSGSEKVKVPNLRVSSGTTGGGATLRYMFPCLIAPGTRLSCRGQLDGTFDASAFVYVRGFDGADPGCGAGMDALGFNAATTLGTPVTPGSNAKGSFSQIIAATARDYRGLMMHVDPQGDGSNFGFETGLVDIAIGPSGQEKVKIPDFGMQLSNFEFIPENSPFWPVAIPAGSRLSARAADLNGVTSPLGVTLYGVY